MKENKGRYKELNAIAREMGLKGTDGHYRTAKGLEIDATACMPDRLALGYLIAKTDGHITKFKVNK